MKKYKLLTPGPLTTSDTVKQMMLMDHCTWDDDYKQITQKIRGDLLRHGHCDDSYTVTLMQGSGTFGIESVLSSVVGQEDKILLCTNGAYGDRMVAMAKLAGIPYLQYEQSLDQILEAEEIAKYLEQDPAITHVAMVHCETTTGILNDLAAVAKVVKGKNKTLIVDAMSSFGGVDIPVQALDIDYIVSSANKCIQGVPGFSFIISKRTALESSQGKARSLSLNLYDQWKGMEKDGKWRYTSPTHTVLAFSKALEELEQEGGISAREARYRANNQMLIERLGKLGFKAYVSPELQSPIISTFYYPNQKGFSFGEFYQYIKERGYAIYPGKLTDAETFRVGNIGEIYPEDMEILADIIQSYMKEKI